MKKGSGQPEQHAVFTPANEPYLGRETVHCFDNLIVTCLEVNRQVAEFTKTKAQNDLQKAASQIIPQGISITLSIRELVRQGYLYSALVLLRPLVERTHIVLYLYKKPEKLVLWKRGWKHGERPNLQTMMDAVAKDFPGEIRGITSRYNSLTHGDPESAFWNLIYDEQGGNFYYAVSKILNNPKLCDEICAEAACWMSVLLSMMTAIFLADASGNGGKERINGLAE